MNQITTANGIAFRFGINNESTGATVQRTDRPPMLTCPNDYNQNFLKKRKISLDFRYYF
ncbi:MAG: hypothetical protein LBK82_06560 [Planctomycetaceae bacterium]|nr:hypothetical protein [Planctomycetaceae bacterium]